MPPSRPAAPVPPEPPARPAPAGPAAGSADPGALAARPFVDDLPPCHGAFPLAAPAPLAAAAALAGAPARPFRRILLAECGTGAGLAMLAAALTGTGARILGAAGDPREAGAARALLAEAGLDDAAGVLAAAPEALRPEDLPELDLVLLPFGWDLMDAPARDAFAALLRARLAPGGAVLCIRDAPPGDWDAATLRRLLANRAAALGPPDGDGPAARAEAAVAALAEMLPACHALLRSLPRWRESTEAIAALPGEVIDRLWLAPRGPLWSMRRMGRWAAAAGLDAWAPAEPLRLVRALDFTPDQIALIDAAPDVWTAQETAELILRRRRRADLFLRPGGPPAEPGALRLIRLPGADPARLEAPGHLGPATLARDRHAPLLDAVAEAAAADPAGSARLSDAAARLGEPAAALGERVAALIGAGALAPAGPGGPAARAACARLNAALLRRGGGGRLASPALGGPAAVSAADARRLRRQLSEAGDDPAPEALGEPLA